MEAKRALFDKVDAMFGPVSLVNNKDICFTAAAAAASAQEDIFSVHDILDQSVVQSILKCRRCGTTDVEYTLVQKRAADEPMTVVAKCRKCGKKWNE
jgi:DNA-directed RNA polymerase subunit M/transcription elongation factor TFIIS